MNPNPIGPSPLFPRQVITDRETGRSRGFGFVTFADASAAAAAVQTMHGADIMGRACRIDFSEDRRGGGGGGGGRGPPGPPGGYAPSGGGGGYDRDRSGGYDRDRSGGYDRGGRDSRGGGGYDGGGRPPPPADQPPPPPDSSAYGYAGPVVEAGAGARGVCNDFLRGACKWGDRCRYSHVGGASQAAPPPSNRRDDGPKVELGGDWNCDGCGNSNFSWRKTCKKCNAPKSQALKDAEKAATGGWLTAGLSDTSNRIFVKGFDPEKVNEDDLKELFGGIGIIARVRQRHGFPDQWPHAVKIYKDESGKPKDEAVIKYDDPMAAQSAPGFYDGFELKGSKLSVSIATSKERPEDEGGGGGGGGGYGGRGGGYGGGRGGGRGGGGYGGRGGGGRGGGYRGGGGGGGYGGGGGGYGGGGGGGYGGGGDRGGYRGGGGGGYDRHRPY